MNKMTTVITLIASAFIISLPGIAIGALTIDHNNAQLNLTQAQYQNAKDNLHIAYGHTSHGSQITIGMSDMVGFINGGGLGLSYDNDFFNWNNGGTGGALDLHDYAMAGDVGYYPQWIQNTVNYLDNPAYSNVNVIIWSWCGQVGDKYATGVLDSEYLTPMSELEAQYPDVTFVYMTGHLDHWDDADNKGANQMIRDYVNAHDKVLFDFADIESYDPDGTFYEYAHDNCDYYDASGTKLGNWAEEWQASHIEDEDWYYTDAVHSKPLNGNQKAYAAWALWAGITEMRNPAVPIPHAVWLLASGLIGIVGIRRRLQK